MGWTITLDATTVSMLAAAAVAAGTALIYLTRRDSMISVIPRLERRYTRLRSEVTELRGVVEGLTGRVGTIWHRLGFSEKTMKAVREEQLGERPRHVVALQLVPLDPPPKAAIPRPAKKTTSLPRVDEEDDGPAPDSSPTRRDTPYSRKRHDS